MFLGIKTGTLSCIVKLPDEVCANHTKRVGENKRFYNLRSSQRCCSLVYPFKIRPQRVEDVACSLLSHFLFCEVHKKNLTVSKLFLFFYILAITTPTTTLPQTTTPPPETTKHPSTTASPDITTSSAPGTGNDYNNH